MRTVVSADCANAGRDASRRAGRRRPRSRQSGRCHALGSDGDGVYGRQSAGDLGERVAEITGHEDCPVVHPDEVCPGLIGAAAGRTRCGSEKFRQSAAQGGP